MAMRVIAIDCDYKRIHVWDTRDGMLFKNEPDWDVVLDRLVLVPDKTPILLEIANPRIHAKSSHITTGEASNRMKWALYNLSFAHFLQKRLCDQLVVAPSSVWTNGYGKKERQIMSGATATTHDLREAQTMAWFYKRQPGKWLTLPAFVERL